MADERPEKILIPHIESPHFRTIAAGGVIVTGPIDSAKTWLLNFYSEGMRVQTESLVKVDPDGNNYRNAGPTEVERVRRDEACIVISQDQLKALVAIVAERLEGQNETSEH